MQDGKSQNILLSDNIQDNEGRNLDINDLDINSKSNRTQNDLKSLDLEKNVNDNIHMCGINDSNSNLKGNDLSIKIKTDEPKINIPYEGPKIDFKNYKFVRDIIISGFIPGFKSYKLDIKGSKININNHHNTKVNLKESNIRSKMICSCCNSLP